MYRKIFILVLLFVTVSKISAQKFYIKPNFGYGIETFKSSFISDSIVHMIYSDTTLTTNTYNLNKISLAKGWNCGLTFGYNINPYLNVELGCNYVFGRPKVIKSSERINFYDDPKHYAELTETSTFKSKSLNIAASLLIGKSFNDFYPYIKIGGILSYVSMSDDYFSSIYTNLPGYYPFSNISYKLKYKSSLAFGLLTSAGMDYKIGENFLLFIDIQNSILYYSPKKATFLNYIDNGVNKINNLNVNEKEIVFVDNYTESSDINEPSKRIKTSFSLCNVSFNLGIKFNLFVKK